MTRFARAKGSKSCNGKVPEDATPWQVLKKGLLIQQEELTNETKTCLSSLKRPDDVNQTLQWSNLDDETENSISLIKSHLRKNELNEKSKDELGGVNGKSKKSEKKLLEAPLTSLDEEKKDVILSDTNIKPQGLKKKSKTVKNFKDVSKEFVRKNDTAENKKRKLEKIIKEDNSGDSVNVTKNKKKMKSFVSKEKDEENTSINDDNMENNLDETERNRKKLEKVRKKKVKNSTGVKCKKNSSGFSTGIYNKVGNKNNVDNGKGKFTTKMNINGEMVGLIKFQGFYIIKEDAKRLKEMKRKLVAEGIPQSQIEKVIKLERRRCEKSLARLKKNVCFLCRKSGHILSQCPEMQNNLETGTGVCYKCGSTEHKAFTCKVAQGQKFPFAECFICKEKGHIARECPDNPRGLYPKGGCCKLCGSVTHLKKDCPVRISEAEEKTIKADIRDDRNLEGLEVSSDKSNVKIGMSNKKKPVTF